MHRVKPGNGAGSDIIGYLHGYTQSQQHQNSVVSSHLYLVLSAMH